MSNGEITAVALMCGFLSALVMFVVLAVVTW